MKRLILSIILIAAGGCAVSAEPTMSTKASSTKTEKMCCFKCCGNQPPAIAAGAHKK